MQKIRLRLWSFVTLSLVFAGGATGCIASTDDGTPDASPAPASTPTVTKTLITPSTSATQAARDFKKSFPSARIFFSQTTGDLLWVDGNGTALAQGAVDTADHALKLVQSFMALYSGLYRIDDPQTMLASTASDLRAGGLAQGAVSLHLEQLQNGVAIQGRHATATFDASGNLLSIESNLMPSSDFQADPSSISLTERLVLRTLPAPSSSTRVLWKRDSKTGLYRIIQESVQKNGLSTIRTLRDASTGKTLETIDETPSELVTAPTGWALSPDSLVAAHSTLGAQVQIASTSVDGVLVLGFHLPGIHASGMGISIGDAASSSNPALAPVNPIATNQADWLSEPAYDSSLRSATTLASNLMTTLGWYKQNLNWSSWDNKGTTLYAAINGNRSGTSVPQVNAWGGGGMVLIGGGLTGTGETLADALDVVAHEFTHSVLTATAPFVYNGESGALNESIADVFGKTAQGFPDFIEGSQAGGYFRDLADPEGCTAPDGHDCTQPGTYAEYKIIASSTDSGGVHTNSGIYNVALTHVIQAPPARAGAASGLVARSLALTQLLLDSFNQQSYDTSLNLEEFAAAFTSYCLARQQAGSLLASQAGYCQQLEASFTAQQLLTAPLQ